MIFAGDVSVRLLLFLYRQGASLIPVWLQNFQNTTETSYAPCNLIIFSICDYYLLNKILVMMF